MLVAAAVLFLFGLSVTAVVVLTSWSRQWYVHASVAVAILPLAALVTLGLTVAAQNSVKLVHDVARSDTIPAFLSQMMLRLRSMESESTTLLNIQLVAILLFVCYASMVVVRHLIDISRLLKISRRRIFMK